MTKWDATHTHQTWLVFVLGVSVCPFRLYAYTFGSRSFLTLSAPCVCVWMSEGCVLMNILNNSLTAHLGWTHFHTFPAAMIRSLTHCVVLGLMTNEAAHSDTCAFHLAISHPIGSSIIYISDYGFLSTYFMADYSGVWSSQQDSMYSGKCPCT